jgi:hypothetical protein
MLAAVVVAWLLLGLMSFLSGRIRLSDLPSNLWQSPQQFLPRPSDAPRP